MIHNIALAVFAVRSVVAVAVAVVGAGVGVGAAVRPACRFVSSWLLPALALLSLFGHQYHYHQLEG